jgi:MFS family permease
MNLTKKRWIILAMSCLVNMCIGSLYAWSVFATPMAEHLSAVIGKRIVGLGIVFTVANSLGPITMISGGFINDKIGPRGVIFAGGLLFSCGMFFSGFASSVGMLIVTYGIFIGLAMGLVYGCTISNSVKFFPDRRGFAGGIATASYGISSVLVPPAANVLIQNIGISSTFKILGSTTAIIISIATVFIQRCPPGFIPDGWQVSLPKKVIQIHTQKITVDKDWKGMLAVPVFYLMLFILLCGSFSGLMVISQVSPIAQRMIGMSVTSATMTVSVLALLNTCGRLAAGFLSDRFGMVKTMIGIFILSIIGLVLLYFSDVGNLLRFYGGVACVGMAFGSIMGTFPGFTATQFGSKNNSVNFGIMFIGFALAGYFAPTIMTILYNRNGSYRMAFLVSVCLAIVGVILSFICASIFKNKQLFQDKNYSN